MAIRKESYFSSFLKRLGMYCLKKSELAERNDANESFLRNTEKDLKDGFHKLGMGRNLSTERSSKSWSSVDTKLPSLICRRPE